MDCSVGVARTKMLAKLGSRAAKPQASAPVRSSGAGVFVIEPCGGDLDSFTHSPFVPFGESGRQRPDDSRLSGSPPSGTLPTIPVVDALQASRTANGRHLAALASRRGRQNGPSRTARSSRSATRRPLPRT